MLTLKKQCLRVALKFRYSRTKTNVVALQRSLNEFTCRALSTSSSDEKYTAPASFKDRWKMLIPALTTHICIGNSVIYHLIIKNTSSKLLPRSIFQDLRSLGHFMPKFSQGRKGLSVLQRQILLSCKQQCLCRLLWLYLG